MTIYIIKNSCMYDNASHELKSKDGKRTIKLTHMRSKCLNFILTHAQELVIRKNHIAEALWDFIYYNNSIYHTKILLALSMVMPMDGQYSSLSKNLCQFIFQHFQYGPSKNPSQP